MKVLWRSDPILNEVGREVRILDLEGDKIMEIGLPVRESFFKRLVAGIKYIFKSNPLTWSVIFMDEQFEEMCRKVSYD